MQKFVLLSTAAAIFLAGCGTPQPSRNWQTVRAVPRIGPGVQNPDVAYAGNLHKALQDANVEHKVVTFKFRYRSRLRLNPEGEETAVIYRDCCTPANPWWIMSERLSTPVWLPTQPVESQVSFYVSRPATIVKIDEFPAGATKPAKKEGSAGKSVVKHASHAVKAKAKTPKGYASKAKASRRKVA